MRFCGHIITHSHSQKSADLDRGRKTDGSSSTASALSPYHRFCLMIHVQLLFLPSATL